MANVYLLWTSFFDCEKGKRNEMRNSHSRRYVSEHERNQSTCMKIDSGSRRCTENAVSFITSQCFCFFLTISRNDTVGHLRNFGDYEYWSWIWSLERCHNKIIRTACMNVGGEEPHVYLLVISDVRREPERNQRNREYVYFTFWKVCLLDNWGSCRTLTTMNMDSVAALLIFSLWIFWYLIFIYCEI